MYSFGRHKLLEREDNASFIRSLVDEVFESSYARILHKTTEDKSYEYSVQWAKKIMLETIEVIKMYNKVRVSGGKGIT